MKRREQEPAPIKKDGQHRSIQEPTVLRTNRISLRFSKKVDALRDISIEAERGQTVGIVGPSGSGKTSLLNCIAGRVAPTLGTVEAIGKVASIHQDLKLVGARSALENVLHGAIGRHSAFATLLRFPSSERRQAQSLLSRVGLDHKMNTNVSRLSGGERQRVAIARALMQDPDILLADEPVSSLDQVSARGIMQLIRELALERQLTVIVVLHDRSLAQGFCDRIVHLSEGGFVREVTVEKGEREQTLLSLEEPPPPPKKREVEEKSYLRPLRRVLTAAMLGVMLLLSFWSLDLSSAAFKDIWQNLGSFVLNLIPSSWGEVRALPWPELLASLVETVQMAFIGTVFGMLGALPLAALAAQNTGPRFVREPVRLLLNMIRTVPSLIWALLFVAAVGLGPVAGILSLIFYSIGYLSKFFYESFENVDPGPTDALKEIGASGIQRFAHAVWPAARPAILADSVFMLEYNVRAASILGIVDAGGIGFFIKEYVDFRYFPAVTACLVLILVVVLILDIFSRQVRHHLVRQNA